MGTIHGDSESKSELDDSGCVEDGSSPDKKQINESRCEVNLLDISDDVLLYIAQHCSPNDLKALGFTCARLGNLIQDHTLWQTVDARDVPYGLQRLEWLVKYGIAKDTTELMITGFAREYKSSKSTNNVDINKQASSFTTLASVNNDATSNGQSSHHDNGSATSIVESGISAANGENSAVKDKSATSGNGSAVSGEIDDSSAVKSAANGDNSAVGDNSATNGGSVTTTSAVNGNDNGDAAEIAEPYRPASRASVQAPRGHATLHLYPQNAYKLHTSSNEMTPSPSDLEPVFTITSPLLRKIRERCNLETLALEYCNIDFNLITVAQFPKTLKKLSLRGTKCFNFPINKSFLFKIHDLLPLLEDIDLSQCAWLDPAALLPLSKVRNLRRLVMCDCRRLTEFVAYASLATRFGFNKLKVIDLRGSPVGDSEVSALGWLPVLEELYASATERFSSENTELNGNIVEIEPWEEKVPSYFKPRDIPDQYTEAVMDYDSTEFATRPIHFGSFTHLDRSCDDTNVPNRRRQRDDMNELEGDRQPGPSKRSRQMNVDMSSDGDTTMSFNKSDDRNDVENKVCIVNLGAGTSRGVGNVSEEVDNNDIEDDLGDPNSAHAIRKRFLRVHDKTEPRDESCNGETRHMTSFVRFRHNKPPIIITSRENQEERCDEERDRATRDRIAEFCRNDRNAESAGPRHHILYVDVGQRIAMSPSINPLNFSQERTCPSNLVSDAAVRNFGRADNEDVTYFRIGQGPVRPGDARYTERPSRSTLRVLSLTGFRRITDDSLVHLATAAPNMMLIDFRNTNVTSNGVERFKSMRPDVKVLFTSKEERTSE